MKTKTIRQTVNFSATPHEVYEALMDSKKHSQFTGAPAKISRQVGGAISAWEGSISGKNLELVADKRIVQMWRSDSPGWPPGHYSKATFSFSKNGKGTKLTFVQTGVPAEAYGDISEGWHEYYWKPMKEFLEK